MTKPRRRRAVDGIKARRLRARRQRKIQASAPPPVPPAATAVAEHNAAEDADADNNLSTVAEGADAVRKLDKPITIADTASDTDTAADTAALAAAANVIVGARSDPAAARKLARRDAKQAAKKRAQAAAANAKRAQQTKDAAAAAGAALDAADDFASAWEDCRREGTKWGGRGRGGRGVARQYQCQSAASRDVCVDGVTLSFDGAELLSRTTLRLSRGRRYALLGRNGVGKPVQLFAE